MARKAYGAQRTMSPAVKARNVAESIITHHLPINDATWERYGLGDDDKAEQRKMVHQFIYLATSRRH